MIKNTLEKKIIAPYYLLYLLTFGLLLGTLDASQSVHSQENLYKILDVSNQPTQKELADVYNTKITGIDDDLKKQTAERSRILDETVKLQENKKENENEKENEKEKAIENKINKLCKLNNIDDRQRLFKAYNILSDPYLKNLYDINGLLVIDLNTRIVYNTFVQYDQLHAHKKYFNQYGHTFLSDLQDQSLLFKPIKGDKYILKEPEFQDIVQNTINLRVKPYTENQQKVQAPDEQANPKDYEDGYTLLMNYARKGDPYGMAILLDCPYVKPFITRTNTEGNEENALDILVRASKARTRNMGDTTYDQRCKQIYTQGYDNIINTFAESYGFPLSTYYGKHGVWNHITYQNKILRPQLKSTLAWAVVVTIVGGIVYARKNLAEKNSKKSRKQSPRY